MEKILVHNEIKYFVLTGLVYYSLAHSGQNMSANKYLKTISV